MVTTADCERVQSAWFRLRATTLGGVAHHDGDLEWTDGPDGLNLLFPRNLTTAAVRRGLDRARAAGRTPVGAWLASDVDPTALADAGFERGWSPWWMVADLADVAAAAPAAGPHVTLEEDADDYRGEHAAYRDQLSLARLRPRVAWYAAAHVGPGRRFAGRAWSFLDGGLAGVFDMAVWPPFRRRGLGTALLGAVCAAAREAGATHAVLNATPEGKLLYETCGFRQVGEGATWWWHAPAGPVEAAPAVGGDA
ncbi:GNAT family N-acetyltransferase [Luteimicrobium sp. NPDC057192]|uniref:GNAT family N-acetyltransferase n=1 Tax=Luteimicrobium sp. NPDC057192 TaxID=3346042 RepID=UPI003628784A